MNAGRCWRILTREDDHLGYVYSSAELDEDAAAAELAGRFPGTSEPRHVRFRVGRHAEMWRGNVAAIGNSYAFVEPLESSGLLTITLGALAVVNSLPASWSHSVGREFVNAAMAYRWDVVRRFLSVHYRFNGRLDTPFWKKVRAETDISGLEPLLEVFRAGAPLRFRDPLTRGFAHSTAPTFYGLGGADTILLGQNVSARILPSVEPIKQWRARRAAAEALVAHALPQREVLGAFDEDPALLRELFADHDSWAARSNPTSLV